MRTLPLLFALACAGEAPPAPPAAEAPAADHSAPHTHNAPHGGQIAMSGPLHVEAVITESGAQFYLTDADQKPLPVEGWQAAVTLIGPSGLQSTTAMAMGDHLHAMGTLVQGQPAKVALTLTKDGVAHSFSYQVEAVGLASHDHQYLHGGVVNMVGEIHVEYAPVATEYRLFVSDANRVALHEGVSGTLRVGDQAVPLAFDAASGLLSAPGDKVGAAPIAAEITVHGVMGVVTFAPVALAP